VNVRILTRHEVNRLQPKRIYATYPVSLTSKQVRNLWQTVQDSARKAFDLGVDKWTAIPTSPKERWCRHHDDVVEEHPDWTEDQQMAEADDRSAAEEGDLIDNARQKEFE
jgi:hypothetical protein